MNITTLSNLTERQAKARAALVEKQEAMLTKKLSEYLRQELEAWHKRHPSRHLEFISGNGTWIILIDYIRHNEWFHHTVNGDDYANERFNPFAQLIDCLEALDESINASLLIGESGWGAAPYLPHTLILEPLDEKLHQRKIVTRLS
jgi:hypothetical protein|tara:strand:- start:7011 stop:7448 length:438 start_codon:yes stop_codon:yes gene_type:complete